jgi:hypothetical protein
MCRTSSHVVRLPTDALSRQLQVDRTRKFLPRIRDTGASFSPASVAGEAGHAQLNCGTPLAQVSARVHSLRPLTLARLHNLVPMCRDHKADGHAHPRAMPLLQWLRVRRLSSSLMLGTTTNSYEPPTPSAHGFRFEPGAGGDRGWKAVPETFGRATRPPEVTLQHTFRHRPR